MIEANAVRPHVTGRLQLIFAQVAPRLSRRPHETLFLRIRAHECRTRGRFRHSQVMSMVFYWAFLIAVFKLPFV
jgi:hypothetical protein